MSHDPTFRSRDFCATSFDEECFSMQDDVGEWAVEHADELALLDRASLDAVASSSGDTEPSNSGRAERVWRLA